MAGGFEDDNDQEIKQGKVEKKEKTSRVVCESDDDAMDCSTLIAMAVVNSVVEEEEDSHQVGKKSPAKPTLGSLTAGLSATTSAPVVTKKVLVDRATSPTLPVHMLPAAEALNTNTNNSNNGGKSVSASAMEKLKEDEMAAQSRRAQIMAQYHSILKDKKLRRTGSVGSVGSRHSLSSSLSLIPEDHLPASRAVTDKTSSEFPNSGNTGASSGGGCGIEDPSVKRVSFQENTPSALASELRLIGRPLPARPLPPIGADLTLYSENGYAMSSPRSGNRPLPPLTGIGSRNSKAYDTLSLHSAGSSTQVLHKSGSTNSLPNPDPRYSTSAENMQKLGGVRRKTPPPPSPPPFLAAPLAYKPLPSIGISNIGFGERPTTPRQAQ